MQDDDSPEPLGLESGDTQHQNPVWEHAVRNVLLSVLCAVLLFGCNKCPEWRSCDGATLAECKSGETWFLRKVVRETDCAALYAGGTCVDLDDSRGAVCASEPLETCNSSKPASCEGDFRLFCDGVGETGPDQGYLQREDCALQGEGFTCVNNDSGIRCGQPQALPALEVVDKPEQEGEPPTQ